MLKHMHNYRLLGAALLALSVYMPMAWAEEAISDEPDTMATQEAPAMFGAAGSYLSSQFAKSSGDVSGAIKYLQRVYKDEPDNAEVASQLEGMLLLDGRIDDAMAIADSFKDDPTDAVSLLLRTLRAVKREDYAAATQAIEPAFQNETGQLWLPLLSAWLDVSQQKPTKPITLEELSGNVGRMTALMNYHLALINNQLGFKEAAAQNFKDAIENPQKAPSRMMENLLAFYQENNKPELLSPVVDAYNVANPDNDLQPEMVVIHTPKDGIAEVLFSMGNIMHAAGVVQDGIVYLQLALYLKPDLNVASLSLGDAYSEVKLYAKANKAYANVSAKDRNYTRAQLRLAINLDKMGKFSEALRQLDQFAKQAPDMRDAYVAKGDLLRIHGKFNEAITTYSQALQRNGVLTDKDWPVLFARGSCYERMGQWKLAEADMQHALELKPDQPDVLNYLGFSWLTRGEHVEEARDMIEKAVMARPNDPQIVDSMAWALYLAGHYEEASGYGERAIELLPSDPTVNDHLGDIYWRMGRKNEARFQWERTLSYSPDTKLAESIHRKLKDGLPPIEVAQGKAPVIASDQRGNAPVP